MENVYEEIANGKYVVPAQQVPGQDGKPQLIFATLNDNAGKAWLPAFTSMDEYVKMYNPNQWVELELVYEQLCKESMGRGIVIDPAGKNIQVTMEMHEEIMRIKSQAQVQANEKDNAEEIPDEAADEIQNPSYYVKPIPNARFSQAVNVPSQIKNAICQVLGQIHEVRRGYLVQMESQEGGHLVLIIDCLGDQKQIFEQVYNYVYPTLGGVILKLHETDVWGLNASINVKPIYKRGLF